MTSDNRYKGSVKRVTIKEIYAGSTQKTYRLYDRSGNLIEYTSEDGKYVLEYNSKNQCIREIWYMGSSIACIWENDFDSHGNVVVCTSVVDGELISKNEFRYNCKGEKIQQIIYDYNVQTFDENNNLIQGSKEIRNFEYDSHGNQIRQFGTRGEYRTIIHYDDNGLIECEEEYDEGGLESTTSYYYDDKGRLESEIKHQCGGIFSTEYSYDFQDNCILEIHRNRDNSGYYVRRIYDFYGNCIGERTYHIGDKEHYREILRQIEYYE